MFVNLEFRKVHYGIKQATCSLVFIQYALVSVVDEVHRVPRVGDRRPLWVLVLQKSHCSKTS
jgi:hypothetical protein